MASRRPSFALSFASSCGTNSNKLDISVIVIPGYHGLPFEKWDVQELKDVAASENTVSRLFFYTYDQPSVLKGEFTWEEYLRSANGLAEAWARLVSENPSRPVLVIAHSLGGALVKKALLLARKKTQDQRFIQVLDLICGIVFLATPHAGRSDNDTLRCFNRVLSHCDKAADVEARDSATQDQYVLAKLAASFEQIADLPILSVYEAEMHWRTGGRKLFSRRSKPLVDEQLATTSCNGESKLGVELGHDELCNLSKIKSPDSAGQFFRAILRDLGVKKPAPTSGTSTTTPAANLMDPLNPLNLAKIELPDKSSETDTVGEAAGSSKAQVSVPLKSAHSLHQLSNTSTGRLLGSRPCRVPCFVIPQDPNLNFVGRRDVIELMDKQLLASEEQQRSRTSSIKFFALCGMGGIGKTDLAIEYAVSRQNQFEVIFWLDAGSISQLATDFGRIPTHLGLESPDDAKDLEASIAIAKAWLYRPWDPKRDRYVSWLLIFDNADDLTTIASYIPQHGQGSVLVTSRDPNAKKHFLSHGTGVDLQPLSTTDSTKLLCSLICRPLETQQADEKDALTKMAAYFDGLPLAVTQMAAFIRADFIRKGQLSIREFANVYASDARYTEIRDVGSAAQQWRYGATLATTYNLKSLSTGAKSLLDTISFLNPDRIREDIFISTNDHAKHDSSCGWTQSDFETARSELTASSIIKRDVAQKEIWIHRIVQAEVRASMNEDVQNKCFRAALSLLYKAWPAGNLISQASKRWALCETLLPHLERAHQLYVDHEKAWASHEIDSRFLNLLNEAAVYLHERGFSQEGKPYLRLALDLCKKADITTEPLVSDMHVTMGALSNETNDAQSCLEHNIISLAIRKAESQKTGTPDLRLAFAHSQMGIAYMMVGKVALATEYFKQSVALLKSIKVDPDEFGFPVCNLGLAQWIQGDLDEADKTLTDLLKQREMLHGRLDRVSYKTGRVLQALGNVKASKAKRMERDRKPAAAASLAETSFAIHKDCLKQYESTLGRFNHRTADACHKIAEHYVRLKDHDKAQDYLDRALSIWGDRRWFKNESARSSFLRGISLKAMGGKENVANGEKWIERAKMLRLEVLSPEDRGAEKEGKNEALTTEDFDRLVCFWSM